MRYRIYVIIAVSLFVFLYACKATPRTAHGANDSNDPKSTASMPASDSNTDTGKHGQNAALESTVTSETSQKPANNQSKTTINVPATPISDGGSAVAVNNGDGFVITEDKAVSIANEALKNSPLGRRVPAQAKHAVRFANGRFEITFLRPATKDPIPGSGFYAMVRVDAKSGEAIVLGEP